MSELPGHPDLDQLRRQARELLRAAADGDSSAVARLHAVSQQVTLSAAQLAVAREYGFPSWPALRAEAERRRSAEPPDAFEDRWSFGGASAAIETAAGVLHPAGLIAGPDHAVLDVSLMPPDGLMPPDEPQDQSAAAALTLSARRARASDATAAMIARVKAVIGEVTMTAVDGRGTGYAVRAMMISGGPGHDRGLISVRLGLDPVPSGECGWVELRGPDGSETRLMRSARPVVRVSEVTPAPGGPAGRKPPDQAGTISAGERADGATHHLDIATGLPRIENTAVRVDSLIAEPESWRIYLRARPSWWIYSHDGRRKRDVLSVHAEDDLGGMYQSQFGGSAGRGDYEELALRFLPRLDPLARALKLTFTAAGKQVTLEFDLR